MDYIYVKQSHQLLAVLSLFLFWWRVFLKIAYCKWLYAKWLKVLPHVNDTLLMGAGLWMCYLLSLWPWQLSWLMVKLLALLVYIGVGGYSLKVASTKGTCLLTAVGATAIFIYIVGIAMSKSVYSWWELYEH